MEVRRRCRGQTSVVNRSTNVRKPTNGHRFHWRRDPNTALNAIGLQQYRERMDERRLQLAELLDFRPDEGVIRLHEQRVVILSAAAMGLLRKELIDTLGLDTARRLLMRFGFADGYHDAVSLRDRKAWSNPVEGLRTGAVVHTLEGIVRSELTSVEFDSNTGRFEAEIEW